KSPGSAFEGSNPSPATRFIVQGIFVNPHTFEGSNPVRQATIFIAFSPVLGGYTFTNNCQ
ncbi:MAG: hypothetical protein WCO85_03415, partial [Actinomycetes bacterium]